MKRYSCIIVDDDPATVDLLNEYIAEMAQLYTLASYTKPLLAKSGFDNMLTPVDFLFLDMQMPIMNGDVLYAEIKSLVHNLIVITSYGDAALSAFDVPAKAFLYKPIRQAKFVLLLERFIAELMVKDQYIILPITPKRERVKIYLNNVIAIESQSNYINIYKTDGILKCYYSISDLEQDLLPFSSFFRVSRAFIISTDHIQAMSLNHVKLDNEMTVQVTRSYTEKYRAYLEHVKKS
ncbi:LytR/AlgR family response regulator transcription factor [Pedobacter duraquae]|uniref:LytTR family two component transcriptional regulator n=1 Tax=Pedobacter duraquae TaxID=425511 RepID=A0A4R6IB11_9SPHI|nr:LytTR family DNA-binding domain-containing protein [Pedobacter duraquae]TDO19380.1 LytTR family two component transcriptional regulator [Pedobacter duraquae]